MKNLVFALSAAALVSAAPLQAQAFSGFTANNDGVEFWDNLSDDGLQFVPQLTQNKCNSGFVVTGAAPVGCINQRPNTWLPYTGAQASTYWNLSGNWAPIVFGAGTYTLEYLGGTISGGCPVGCVGGDIAGANLDWGIYAINDRSTLLNFNTTYPLPATLTAGVNWGLWVNLLGGGTAFSDTDPQFALFGFGRLDPTTWIAGIEDNGAGDWDYQDMMFRITAEDGGTPQETVPEPATMTLLATGLAGMAAAKRRRNRK
ncbi:MAG: PEP-CTERM sorting domain-containing protein [Gemmatimonadales bacterium]|nr:PEP-CTERM sorting domain-containing protein [Gemmatimonadales bacterium]MBP6572455.1 PEP-CTERM sorting domain-containing protein [Gemmatimonadales bacterium]